MFITSTPLVAAENVNILRCIRKNPFAINQAKDCCMMYKYHVIDKMAALF